LLAALAAQETSLDQAQLGKAADLVVEAEQTGQSTMFPSQEAAELLGKATMEAQRLVYLQPLVAAEAARVQRVLLALALLEAQAAQARNPA
jgi:hypothetical protein